VPPSNFSLVPRLDGRGKTLETEDPPDDVGLVQNVAADRAVGVQKEEDVVFAAAVGGEDPHAVDDVMEGRLVVELDIEQFRTVTGIVSHPHSMGWFC
jgi:hypothetical protein